MVKILFDQCGSFRFIHSDEGAAVMRAVAPLRIRRASSVEPTPEGTWTADLSPVNGPTLGPFETRAEALSAELEWLTSHDVPLPR